MNAKPAFEVVVREHGSRVLRVCRAVVGPVDADDAWSETFLAALRAYPDLPGDANLEAWLVTIAHRKAIDLVRHRQRQPVAVAVVPERVSGTGLPGSGPVAGPGDGSGDAEIWTAVAALPDKQRLCIAYHYLGGLAFADVADIVGGTPDAARRAAHDGIKSLRRKGVAR
jgi:DNA-directed RNA polymerase specialized sigma24 family protein